MVPPSPVYSLNYQDSYPCPACRQGRITPMTLMDAFGCNTCRHLFTANLEAQVLLMADSSVPRLWRWTGEYWRGGTQSQPIFTPLLIWGGVGFVILPPLLVGLTAYIFPPLPDDPLNWLPFAWTGLTFVVHLSIVVGLVLDYYQPVFFTIWLQRWSTSRNQ